MCCSQYTAAAAKEQYAIRRNPGGVYHLSMPEARAALDFLWRVRRTADIAGFVGIVLEGFKTLIPCELVSYNEFHAASRTIRTTAIPASVLPPDGTAAVTRHFRDHPLLLHQLQTGDGSPRRITDMTSMRTFRETALFSELYHPMRLRWEIAMTLPAPSGTVRCVALHRDRRDFAERDLELLRLVRPYLFDAQRELDAAGRVRLLSRRERDAMALVARGKTNIEVAAALKISPRTVQKHLQHVYDKLGVRRRAGAAVLARLLGAPGEDGGETG
jgi:DNA-binding CsgD family transcriptional regulator